MSGLAMLGAAPVADPPEESSRFLVAEWEIYARLVRDAKIRAD
jgi:hypothetical protein